MSLMFERALAAWRECRADYELALYAAYVRAEAATNGALLNDRGRARDIDPLSLFMGPEIRAHAYASEELMDHWAIWPRVTFASFERTWHESPEDAREPMDPAEWEESASAWRDAQRPWNPVTVEDTPETGGSEEEL